MFRLLAILFLGTSLAGAQQQERKLMDRLLKPDLTQGNAMQKKAFIGGKSTDIKTFSTDKYSGVRTKDTGTYVTRSFLGIRNPWLGNKEIVLSKTADLNAKPGLANMDRKLKEPKYATSAYSQSDRPTSLTPKTVDTKPAASPAKAQGTMDAISGKMNKELSIDDVRAILNKQH